MKKAFLARSMVVWVTAIAMTRQEYNDFRGWSVPSNENPLDDGFLIEDQGGEKNTPQYNGYVQWLPKAEFERKFVSEDGDNSFEAPEKQLNHNLSFSEALEHLKKGARVARSGWNGKGMWLILTPGRTVENLEPNSFYEKCGFEAPVTITGHIDMKAADGSMVVGWLASQTDMLANDWQVLCDVKK